MDINKLNNIRDQELISKYKIYNNILSLIHNKITYSSKKKKTNSLYIQEPLFYYDNSHGDGRNYSKFY